MNALGFLLISAFFFPLAAVADAVVQVSLEDLVAKAKVQNLEIKAERSEQDSLRSTRSQARSAFYPEIGLEGGYQTHQSSDEKSSNPFAFTYAKYNLFRGFADKQGLAIKSKELENSELALEETIRRVSRQTAHYFYELLYLQSLKVLKEEALKLNESQKEMAIRKKHGGFTSNADVLEFELREATLKSDLTFIEQELHSAYRELARLLNESDVVEYRPQGELKHEHLAEGLEHWLSISTREKLELQASKNTVDIKENEHAASLSGWLPEVNLTGNYGSLPKSERVLDSSPSWSAEVRATLPLFSGFSSSSLRAAKSMQVSAAETRFAKMRLETKTSIQNSFFRLKTIEERVDIEEKNLERAKQYYELTAAEYKRGVKNSPDLSGASERFIESQKRLLEYKKDYFQAKLTLYEAVGVGI